MTIAEHYTYRLRWSAEDGGFIGTVAELPSLSWVAGNLESALLGIRELAAGIVQDMNLGGELPPSAIADRDFSGSFMVQIPPELHRRLAIKAAERAVSFGHLAARRLSGE